MPTIRVNTSKISSYESEMEKVLSRVNLISSELSHITTNLDWDIKVASSISFSMTELERSLSAQAQGIRRMNYFLNDARTQYDAVDNRNKENLR